MTEAGLSASPLTVQSSVHNVVCFVISLFLIHIQNIHGDMKKIVLLKCFYKFYF